MKTTTRYAAATPENWRDVRSLLEILPLRIDKVALFAELDQLAEVPQGWPLDNRTLSKLCDGKLGRRSILGSDALQALFRGLLYAFVSSETGRVLSQEKIARAETHHLHRQLRHFRPLIGIWSVQRYPMLSHLLLNPQLKLQYSSLISIPVLQFVRYVPGFVLFRLETICEKPIQTVWVRWMAAGKNICTAPHLPFPLSRRMAHWLAQTPVQLSFREAFLYCRVRSAGGSEELFRTLHNFYGQRNLDWSFIDQLSRFFMRHQVLSALDWQQLQQVMTYIEHRHREEEDFHFRGRTLRALVRRAAEWEAARIQQAQAAWRGGYPASWEGMRIRGFEQPESRCKKVIVQLTTREELHREGVALHHCVATYGGRCAAGHTSIWSLRRIDQEGQFESLVTIELNAYREIVQAGGPYNAAPRPEEIELIKAWASAERLTWKG